MKNCHTQVIFAIGAMITLIFATAGIVYAQIKGQVLDNTLNNICVAIIAGVFTLMQRPTPQPPTPPPGTVETKTTSTQPASTVTTTENP